MLHEIKNKTKDVEQLKLDKKKRRQCSSPKSPAHSFFNFQTLTDCWPLWIKYGFMQFSKYCMFYLLNLFNYIQHSNFFRTGFVRKIDDYRFFWVKRKTNCFMTLWSISSLNLKQAQKGTMSDCLRIHFTLLTLQHDSPLGPVKNLQFII